MNDEPSSPERGEDRDSDAEPEQPATEERGGPMPTTDDVVVAPPLIRSWRFLRAVLIPDASEKDASRTDLKAAAKRIVRNAGSVLIGNAAGEAMTAYAIVLAAISLGPGGFGQLSSAQALVEPFDLLAGFGMGQILIKIAAGRNGVDGTLRGTALGLRMVFTTLSMGAVFALAAATGRGSLLHLIALLAIGSYMTGLQGIALMPFEFEQTMHKRIAVPFLVSLLRLGTAFLAVYFLNQPFGFQLSGLSAGVLTAVIHLWLSHRHYRARYRFDWELAKRVIKLAWPVAVIEFVSMCYMRGSYFLLHSYGDEVQGQYAAADRLIRPLLGIGAIFFLSTLPTAAALAEDKSYQTLWRLYRGVIKRMVGAGLPLLVVVWFGAPWLLERFVPQYAAAAWPFRILSIGALFIFLNQASYIFVIALGRQRLIMYVALVNAVVYFSLALFLIPRYEATGAALATAVMEAINTVMQVSVVAVLLRRARHSVATTAGPEDAGPESGDDEG